MTFSARSSEYGLSGLEKTDFHAGSKYDTLLIASAMIDDARVAYQLGRLPIGAKDLLNTLIHSYNLTRQSWLTYRGAMATNAAPDIYFDELTENLKDLTTAIRAFEEAK